MKKLALFGIILGITGLTSCVRTHNPAPVYEKYYYTEDYLDNRNGWEFIDRAYNAEGYISGGTYKIAYYDDYEPAYYISQQMGFNYNDDFIIEAKFGSNYEMGLLFGIDDRRGAYGYSINIDVDGYLRMYDEGGNGYGPDVTEIISPFRDGAINSGGDWNVVRIEQTGGEWFISVNGYLMERMPAQRLQGSGVGYVLMPFTEGEVDFLDVAGYY